MNPSNRKKFSEKGRLVNMKLSILTATYNREKYLYKLYKSIIQNIKTSNIEAEWIVIDDGSTDNTKTIIEKWRDLNNPKITIKYIYQKNLGKMAAINKGTERITGELTVDCDSDDYFTNNAFQIIEEYAPKLLKNKELYALCFLKENLEGKTSGKKFPRSNMLSTMFDLYFKQEIEGEKILVFNTQIRKKFKHELEKNEKFITEARMYHKMDEFYSILCINEIVQIGDYLKNGYTQNISKTFNTSPNGYYKYFKEILQKGLKGVTLNKKIYVLKHFLYFAIKKIFSKKAPIR